MTAPRILRLNAISTAAGALGMLGARGTLYSLFGLDTPLLLDVLAVGLLAYAACLGASARRQPVERRALLFFTAADVAWVVGSAAALVLFWPQLSPLARVLVAAAALVVEAFAILQYRAAAGATGAEVLPSRSPAAR